MADIREFLRRREDWVEGYTTALDDLESWTADQELASEPKEVDPSVRWKYDPAKDQFGDHSLPEVDAVRERQRQAVLLWDALGRQPGAAEFDALSQDVRNKYFAVVDRLQASRPPTPREAELLEKIRSLERQGKADAVRLAEARDNVHGMLEWARINADPASTPGWSQDQRDLYRAFATRLSVFREELGE